MKKAFVLALCLGAAVPALAQNAEPTQQAGDATLAAKFREMHAAAERGDAEAQFYLGVMYEYGQGVAQDDALAAAWYRKAADQGNAKAQHNLGVLYNFGRGVAQDDAQAVAWFRKAADQGLADAQDALRRLETAGRIK